MADDLGIARMPDGREVAYRIVSGDGPVIVHTPNGGVSIELIDDDPMYARFVQTLASAGRLVLYDGFGIGASDPVDPDRHQFPQRSEALVAVLDAVDAPAAWIVGSHPAWVAETIRTFRDRVAGAVLINPVSGRQLRRNAELAQDGQRRTPAEVAREFFPSRADDAAFVDWLRRAHRLGSTNAEASARLISNSDAVERFVAEAQPILDAPPVMLIRRRDGMSLAMLEWWKRIFPDAEVVTIEGADVDVLGLDAGLVAELATGFITGAQVTIPAQRQLVALLFTDLVGSTTAASVSGDVVWRSTLDRYEAAVQRTVQRHHGTVVKHTGDGALATFPSGSEALAAAVELRNLTRDLGLEGRTGVHVGEIEQRNDDIGGIAVNLAARVMGQAEPGQIVATVAVVDTTVGGRYRYENLGDRTLKGIGRSWHLVTVEA